MRRVATLSAEECAVWLEALRTGRGVGRGARQRLRNWGMGMVLLEAGLRVSELVGLDVCDLIFHGAPVRTLIVRGAIAKRGVEREIPVSVRLHGALSELQRRLWVDMLIGPGVAAWTGNRGGRRLRVRQVEGIVRRAALASLGRPVHPHMCRHTCGTRWERVAGIRVAQALLGHGDIRTTEIYCHPGADDLARAVNGGGRGVGL